MYNSLLSEQFLLNLTGQNVTIFNITEGETIKEGDFVVVNTRTLSASTPKKESGYYAVGRAARIVTSETGQKMVVCRDGIFVTNSTSVPEHKMDDSDNGRACYFESPNSVTLNNINTTKAGEILSVPEENKVLIKININSGGKFEW